jgi:hypothetical protein
MNLKLREAMVSQAASSLRFSTHLISLAGSASSNLAFSPFSIHSLLSLLTTAPFLPRLPIASDLITLYTQISNVVLHDGSAARGPRLYYTNGVWVDFDASTNLTNSFIEVATLVYKAKAHAVPFRSMVRSFTEQLFVFVHL